MKKWERPIKRGPDTRGCFTNTKDFPGVGNSHLWEEMGSMMFPHDATVYFCPKCKNTTILDNAVLVISIHKARIVDNGLAELSG